MPDDGSKAYDPMEIDVDEDDPLLLAIQAPSTPYTPRTESDGRVPAGKAHAGEELKKKKLPRPVPRAAQFAAQKASLHVSAGGDAAIGTHGAIGGQRSSLASKHELAEDDPLMAAITACERNVRPRTAQESNAGLAKLAAVADPLVKAVGNPCSVLLSAVPDRWNESEIRELCGRYGSVQGVQSGCRPGDFEVMFTTPQAAAKVVTSLDGLQISGPGGFHTLRCRSSADPEASVTEQASRRRHSRWVSESGNVPEAAPGPVLAQSVPSSSSKAAVTRTPLAARKDASLGSQSTAGSKPSDTAAEGVTAQCAAARGVATTRTAKALEVPAPWLQLRRSRRNTGQIAGSVEASKAPISIGGIANAGVVSLQRKPAEVDDGKKATLGSIDPVQWLRDKEPKDVVPDGTQPVKHTRSPLRADHDKKMNRSSMYSMRWRQSEAPKDVLADCAQGVKHLRALSEIDRDKKLTRGLMDPVQWHRSEELQDVAADGAHQIRSPGEPTNEVAINTADSGPVLAMTMNVAPLGSTTAVDASSVSAPADTMAPCETSGDVAAGDKASAVDTPLPGDALEEFGRFEDYKPPAHVPAWDAWGGSDAGPPESGESEGAEFPHTQEGSEGDGDRQPTAIAGSFVEASYGGQAEAAIPLPTAKAVPRAVGGQCNGAQWQDDQWNCQQWRNNQWYDIKSYRDWNASAHQPPSDDGWKSDLWESDWSVSRKQTALETPWTVGSRKPRDDHQWNGAQRNIVSQPSQNSDQWSFSEWDQWGEEAKVASYEILDVQPNSNQNMPQECVDHTEQEPLQQMEEQQQQQQRQRQRDLHQQQPSQAQTQTQDLEQEQVQAQDQHLPHHSLFSVGHQSTQDGFNSLLGPGQGQDTADPPIIGHQLFLMQQMQLSRQHQDTLAGAMQLRDSMLRQQFLTQQMMLHLAPNYSQ